MTEPPNAVATLCRFADVGLSADIVSGIDNIFFSSSNTQHFDSEQHRRDFRTRWLGRYLDYDGHLASIAMIDGRVTGYVVGSVDDPALTARFADIGYFQTFSHLTARFPAHLHVNIAANARGSGLGSALVTRFCHDARAAGARGVHVVTGRGARNVTFYVRNGFEQVGATGAGAHEVVMLARQL